MKNFGVIIFTRKLFGVIIPSYGILNPWFKGVIVACFGIITTGSDFLGAIFPNFKGVILPGVYEDTRRHVSRPPPLTAYFVKFGRLGD